MQSFAIRCLMLLLLAVFYSIPKLLLGIEAETLQSGCRNVPVVDIGRTLQGDYIRTHGQNVQGIAAPYVEEYAKLNEIDLDRVGHSLFPEGFPHPSAPESVTVFIGSPKHLTGDWTHITSVSILFYQLLKVRIGNSLEPKILVLYNRSTPDQVILDQFQAEWHLAILSKQYEVLADRSFETYLKHQIPGMWDMISTSLAIEESMPIVKIIYAHTGGGGGRDQEFTFWFTVKDNPVRLQLLEGKQTLDLYNEEE